MKLVSQGKILSFFAAVPDGASRLMDVEITLLGQGVAQGCALTPDTYGEEVASQRFGGNVIGGNGGSGPISITERIPQ